MEFIRDICRKVGEGFKDTADKTWDALGDTEAFPEEFKEIGKSAGKYALTAQLLMTLNFPQEAEFFRNSFNYANDKGPVGSRGFSGTPLGDILDYVADTADQRQTQAIGVLGYEGDIENTSTFDDLLDLLDVLENIAEGEEPEQEEEE